MRTTTNPLLKLAALGVFSLAFAGLALASGHEREDCHSQPAAAVPTIAIVSPIDGTFTPSPTTTLEVAYTAPSGTIPLITLLRNGVAVDSFTIPAGSTAGSVLFVQDISTVNGPTAFQAQIAYVAGEAEEDHDGEHHKKDSKKSDKSHKGKHGKGHSHGDDEDDDDDGGTVTVVPSNVVNVLHAVAGPPVVL